MTRSSLLLVSAGLALAIVSSSGCGESMVTDPTAVDVAEQDPTTGGCPITPGAPQKEVFFSKGWPDPDETLEQEVVRLVDSTPPGARIRLSMFSWSRTPVSDALIAARARGVDVRVVIDEVSQHEEPAGSGNWVWNQPVIDLQNNLGDGGVTLCDQDSPPDRGACIGTGINHNKFYLFSELCDGSTDVVVQSSANLTSLQLKLRNNMIVMRDDPAMFAGYESYWNDLAARVPNPDYYRKADGIGTRAYFYPRAGTTATSDTVYNILHDNVTCTGGTVVRLAMASWSSERIYLADELAALLTAGCDVRLIVSDDSASQPVKDHLRSLFGPKHLLITSGLHHKYLVIDGQYLGAPARLVFTGSHNYTGAALRDNDETMLRVDDGGVVDAFLADWIDMWTALRGP